MLNLMKQELRRNNIRIYILAAIISCVGLTAFIYFISYAAQYDNKVEFQNYTNIIRFVLIMSLLVFSMLSATMYSRFIIDEYNGAKLALLFSYPVNRKRILVSKLLVISIFTIISMTATITVALTLFCITEYISPILHDTFSFSLFMTTVQSMGMCIVGSVTIGVISMRVGFVKKSTPTTLITAFLLSGVVGNAIIGAAENLLLGIGLITVLIIITLTIIIELSNRINEMEVE